MKIKAFVLVIVTLLLSAGWSVSHAVVTTNITSSGLGTTLNGGAVCTSSCTITGGTRPGGGPNLFHSFGLFSVGTGDTANFFNDSGLSTSNILSRVTGGVTSSIFGTIQTTGFGSANLFLINPAGVVFGPTASLHIGGSFHVSTADYIRLTDGVRFNAVPNTAQDALLSTAPVAAFGFLSSNPAAISIQGSTTSSLAVPSGKTLSVVGGDLTMTGGKLAAPGGQINLASVASPGEVLLPSLQTGPNVNGDSVTAFGALTLSAGAKVDVSGNGGTVLIRGGQLVMNNASLIANTTGLVGSPTSSISIDADTLSLTGGAKITTKTSGPGPGGTVTIAARDSVSISGLGSQISTTTTTSTGAAGNILITTPTLTLNQSAKISGSTSGSGQGGTVIVTATENISLTDSSVVSQALSRSTSAGDGGLVKLTAPTIDLQGGLISTTTGGPGRAGDIVLEASRLSLKQSAQGAISDIFADTQGSGHGGNITIQGLGGSGSRAEEVTISGHSRLGAQTFGRLLSNGLPASRGDAGNIRVETGRLTLTDGGLISNNSENISPGAAGNITVNAAEEVTISGGGKLTSSSIHQASGNAGHIAVSAPRLVLQDGGVIATTTTNTGNAGSIEVNAGILRLSTGGQITSSSLRSDFTPATITTGTGGAVTLHASNVQISGRDALGRPSGVFTASEGAGAGGNIGLTANVIRLDDGATISAKASGTGNGGDILIHASDALLSRNSRITTETLQSDGGNITIQAGRLVQLIDSKITTSVSSGVGNGGNITIDPQFVILQGSQILAQAFGGNGGNILIVAGMFFADPLSVVSASSTLGINGTVNIQAPVSNLSGTLAPLPEEFVQAASLLKARCAAQIGGQFSSLVVAGRDGMPLEPGGLLPSPLFAEGLGSTRLAGASSLPSLRVGRAFGDPDLTLAALDAGCAS